MARVTENFWLSKTMSCVSYILSIMTADVLAIQGALEFLPNGPVICKVLPCQDFILFHGTIETDRPILNAFVE